MDSTSFYIGFTKAISSSLDIGKALEQTLSFIRTCVPADLLGLFYFDFDHESLFCLAEASAKGHVSMVSNPVNCGRLSPLFNSMGNTGWHSTVAAYPDVDIVTREERDWYRDNNPVIMQRYGEFESGSMMRLWLHIADDITGTLMVMSRTPEIFGEDVIGLFRQVRDPVTIAMSNARRYQDLLILKSRLEDDNRAMQLELIRESGSRPVGEEFGLKNVMAMARQVSNMPSPVLLLGETGTGKEVIANVIHHFSDRRSGPLVKVQCGAIPDSLLNSELFGHEKGAFTGAMGLFRGRFERAEGGTLFLDEIGELTLDAQVKLLRVLQEHKIERLGGDRTIDVNVRIIAATNRNLSQMVHDGKFREDLWFRLNVFPIHIPPLRYRKEDIPSLVSHFVSKKRKELGVLQQPLIRHSTLRDLIEYDWPGNVRELQNVIERALILNPGPFLEIPEAFLKPYTDQSSTSSSDIIESSPDHVFQSLETIQKNHIRKALTISQGQVNGKNGAAELLNINPSTLRARMRKFGIPFGTDASF